MINTITWKIDRFHMQELMRRCTIAIIFGILFLPVSCDQPSKQRNIERAFYYWKSVLNITEYEKKALTDLKVKTLYLKFFDVDWDENSNGPVPVAQIRMSDDNPLKKDSLTIIPVVFITNSCIRYLDSLQAEETGKKILDLVDNICKTNKLNYSELQIDCDWTALTRDKYFTLLRSIKKHLNGRKLSATIRLYQVKYSGKTGVPPVDRGLLMAYNMGNLKDPATGNSIIESRELKKYISELSNYSLPLDIALPLFEWKVFFRNNTYAGLMENLPDSFLDNRSVKKMPGNRYQFLIDTVLNGYSFLRGDILRKEESTYEEILATEKLISGNLSTLNIRLSLFHLDSLILKKYPSHEMEAIFHGLD